MYILDASVIVKWFIEEDDTKKAKALMDGHIRGRFVLIMPGLLIYEVSNVLKMSGGFSEDEIHESIQRLYDLGLEIVAPLPNIVHPPIALMFKRKISFYDAFYVSLADMLGFEFITADERLYTKVRDLSFVKLLRNFEFEIRR
ncbi:MAG: type II toxin-antitoxin system VapC family toxin [bacterium]